MRRPARTVFTDLEVVELLAAEPELLAIADAVAATQPRQRRRGGVARVAALAAVVALLGAAVLVLPQGGGERGLLEQALAAVGSGPVVHARIEARLPATDVVELATGRTVPQTVAIEYWYDEPRGRLRTVVRRAGVVVEEFVETRTGASSAGGPVVRAAGAQPTLDPALAGFVTRYRHELAAGQARTLEEGELDGRPVVWLELGEGGSRERVAVDRDSFVPLLIVPLDAQGRETPVRWRVRLIATGARVEADFAPPPRRPARPFRGDVRDSEPLSSAQAAALSWPALWLGERWQGLRLVSLELQTLSRGFPPGSGRAAERGQGLRLRYAVDGESRYVEISQAASPEPAYGFAEGAATFGWNPIPAEGFVEVVALAGGSDGTPTLIGQLRRDGVYVTIWASSRGLLLEAARALGRFPATGGVGR